ncbi:MAG: DUF5016 domain-containing protein [Prevotellaceae bacterium]|jgi:hypothetical protein|nr:DUF5016 domain-containing protein [Prevotellaceae bacterium]
MKNIFKILIVLTSVTVLFSCKEDELRVKYPFSIPAMSNISVSEAEITYGDSITLNVGEIRDNVAPLSTLEIQIVVNNIILDKQSVRTKGNTASYNGKFHVPFGAYMAEGAAVKVYLSAINVEGNRADTIIATTIAHRPAIEHLYIVPTSGGAFELPLSDAENCIYSANNLSLGNDVTFYLATKVSRFGNIDWTGLVFGSANDGLGLVQEGGAALTLKDLSLMGFKKVTADLLYFTVTGEGDPLTPITEMNVADFEEVTISSTNHLGSSTSEVWKKADLYFGFGDEITVSGVNNIANGFTPDFFEVTAADKVKFLGETGVYTVYYLPSADYVWVEQTDATFPSALWLCGVGYGRPQTPYAKTSSWNWNSPLEYVFCRKISDGVFQATIYVEHVIDESVPADAWKYCFNAKFFEQRGWGGETDARQYTINTPLIVAPTIEDVGNFKGTDALTTQAGVYRFTINVNAKTVEFAKIN